MTIKRYTSRAVSLVGRLAFEMQQTVDFESQLRSAMYKVPRAKIHKRRLIVSYPKRYQAYTGKYSKSSLYLQVDIAAEQVC